MKLENSWSSLVRATVRPGQHIYLTDNKKLSTVFSRIDIYTDKLPNRLNSNVVIILYFSLLSFLTFHKGMNVYPFMIRDCIISLNCSHYITLNKYQLLVII